MACFEYFIHYLLNLAVFCHFQLTVQCFFHSSMLYFLIKEHLTIPFYQTRRQLFNWPRRKIPWANTEKHHANFISAAANVQRVVLPSTRLTVSTAANIIQEPKSAILTRRNAIMNSSAVKSLPETTPERGLYEFTIFYHEIFSHR